LQRRYECTRQLFRRPDAASTTTRAYTHCVYHPLAPARLHVIDQPRPDSFSHRSIHSRGARTPQSIERKAAEGNDGETQQYLNNKAINNVDMMNNCLTEQVAAQGRIGTARVKVE